MKNGAHKGKMFLYAQWEVRVCPLADPSLQENGLWHSEWLKAFSEQRIESQFIFFSFFSSRFFSQTPCSTMNNSLLEIYSFYFKGLLDNGGKHSLCARPIQSHLCTLFLRVCITMKFMHVYTVYCSLSIAQLKRLCLIYAPPYAGVTQQK